jgi:hypothetical protein
MARAAGVDVKSSWVWSNVPPSLRDVAKGARVTERIPGGVPQLRAGWVAWNYVVAVPMTALLYAAAWVFQHPLRTLAAVVVAGTILAMWITG